MKDATVARKMTAPFDGKNYGCNDGPELRTSVHILSRLTDAMYAAQEAGLNPDDVFILAPYEVRMDWNFSKWSYRKAY